MCEIILDLSGAYLLRMSGAMGCQDSATIPQPPKKHLDPTPAMAPNLVASQHELIRDMIICKSLKTDQMAEVAGCSPRSIKTIHSNLRCFGNTRAPFNGGGRP